VPPLLNADAVVQCAHRGKFMVLPRGPRPVVGGPPGLNVGGTPSIPVASAGQMTVQGT
jgi:hypothetical protein